jgi:hypothetical protein
VLPLSLPVAVKKGDMEGEPEDEDDQPVEETQEVLVPEAVVVPEELPVAIAACEDDAEAELGEEPLVVTAGLAVRLPAPAPVAVTEGASVAAGEPVPDRELNRDVEAAWEADALVVSDAVGDTVLVLLPLTVVEGDCVAEAVGLGVTAGAPLPVGAGVVVALGVLVAVPEALSEPVALGVMMVLVPADSELVAAAEARGSGVVDGVAVFDAVPVGVGVEEPVGLKESVGEKDTVGEAVADAAEAEKPVEVPGAPTLARETKPAGETARKTKEPLRSSMGVMLESTGSQAVCLMRPRRRRPRRSTGSAWRPRLSTRRARRPRWGPWRS